MGCANVGDALLARLGARAGSLASLDSRGSVRSEELEACAVEQLAPRLRSLSLDGGELVLRALERSTATKLADLELDLHSVCAMGPRPLVAGLRRPSCSSLLRRCGTAAPNLRNLTLRNLSGHPDYDGIHRNADDDDAIATRDAPPLPLRFLTSLELTQLATRTAIALLAPLSELPRA